MNAIQSAVVNALANLADLISGGRVRVIYQSHELAKAAKAITDEVGAEISNASAENKHARAYARLRRKFPHLPNRDIGLAIELALR
jgi:hypothetical protein